MTPSPAGFRSLHAQLSRRRLIRSVGFVIAGIVAGVLAGSLPAWWPDIALAVVIVLLTIVLPLALVPVVRNRVASGRAAPTTPGR